MCAPQQGWLSLVLFTFTVHVAVAQPPTEAAASISFVDNSSIPGQLLGNVTIMPGKLSTASFEYRVYFATTGLGSTPHATPLPMGNAVVIFKTLSAKAAGANQSFSYPLQGECLSDPTYLYSPLVPCTAATTIPSGATHLLVRSANSFGNLATTGRWTKIVDWTGSVPGPAARPYKVTFVDKDYDRYSIGGVVDIVVTTPEPIDIATYRVYWHGIDGIVGQVLLGGLQEWVVEVPAIGYSTQAIIPNGTTTPSKAKRLHVVAHNRVGMALKGREAAIKDKGFKTAEHSDLTGLVGGAIGGGCFLFISALVVVALRKRIIRKCYNNGEPRTVEAKEGQEVSLAIEDAQKPVPKPVVDKDTRWTFDEGTQVEFWDSRVDTFVPAIIMGPQEVRELPVPVENKQTKSMHTPVGEKPRRPVWLRMSVGAEVLQDADPARLRFPLQSGEPIEVCQNEAWLQGIIEVVRSGPEGNFVYDVRVVSQAIFLENVAAHELRRCFIVATKVEVWQNGQWKIGKVVDASPNAVHEELDFPSQELVVCTPEGETFKTSSKDIRWARTAGYELC